MNMGEQVSSAVWEMSVNWNGSEVELGQLQRRIELPFVEKDGITSLPINGRDRDHSPERVQQEAEDLLVCLNGALRVEGVKGSFSLGVLRRNESGGKSTQYIFLESTCSIGIGATATITCYDKDGNLIPDPPVERKPLLGMGAQNSRVRQLLGFAAKLQQDDWPTLYKIVEIVINSGAPLREWGVKQVLDKVKDVANNPEAVGLKARHAVIKGSPSKARMTFDQARNEVFQVVQKWLEYESARAEG